MDAFGPKLKGSAEQHFCLLPNSQTLKNDTTCIPAGLFLCFTLHVNNFNRYLFTGLPKNMTSRKATISARLDYLKFHSIPSHVCSFPRSGFSLSLYVGFCMLAFGSWPSIWMDFGQSLGTDCITSNQIASLPWSQYKSSIKYKNSGSLVKCPEYMLLPCR